MNDVPLLYSITAEEGLRGQNIPFIDHILCDLLTSSPISAVQQHSNEPLHYFVCVCV